jgi:hypothetical protein
MRCFGLAFVLGLSPVASWGSGGVQDFSKGVEQQLASCLENLRFSAEFGECLSTAEKKYMGFIEARHTSNQAVLVKFQKVLDSCNVLVEGDDADYAGHAICRLENARNFAVFDEVNYLDRVNKYIGLSDGQSDQSSDIPGYAGTLYWHGGNVFNCYYWHADSLESAVKYVSGEAGSRVVEVKGTGNGVLIKLVGRDIQAWYEKIDCQEDRLKLPGAISH